MGVKTGACEQGIHSYERMKRQPIQGVSMNVEGQ